MVGELVLQKQCYNPPLPPQLQRPWCGRWSCWTTWRLWTMTGTWRSWAPWWRSSRSTRSSPRWWSPAASSTAPTRSCPSPPCCQVTPGASPRQPPPAFRCYRAQRAMATARLLYRRRSAVTGRNAPWQPPASFTAAVPLLPGATRHGNRLPPLPPVFPCCRVQRGMATACLLYRRRSVHAVHTTLWRPPAIFTTRVL